MPEKYHIATKAVPSRLPKIGKFGVVDWREDCARCHNCVKKECVYDRYRQEADYIRKLQDVDAFFYECMGCFSCVQKCTKGILALTVNPVYERLGNSYFTPDIIQTTWNQAETAGIPVSGAGYRGKFTGPGFDAMWTDMSEIVRPTRDGIHGREYISTSVDIGRKPPLLHFAGNNLHQEPIPLVDIPMPLIIDMMPAEYNLHNITPYLLGTAARTHLLAIVDYREWQKSGGKLEQFLPQVVFYLSHDAPLPDKEILQKTKLVEISYGDNVESRIKAIKELHPQIVVAVRVELDERGIERAVNLGHNKSTEVIHLVADSNGNQIGVPNPRFIADMVRQIHTTLVKDGSRDEITLMSGGGIALPEHMAKQLLCGADLITINLPLLIAMECRLCPKCDLGTTCPAKIDDIDASYAVGRMTNLISAWHSQLLEVMGAMGIREARRLRGETGRALFFKDLEEETFGRLFGKRK
jgi:ferredoxin